ncbi:MAG: MBL fold metallo-hydrolase [Candidatus Jordarchaeales archaeon]|nr:MBL fold metallo-hydrolase [Candidatus Jordarchaeia archaeon]
MVVLEKVCGNIYLVRGDGNGRFPHSFSVLILDERNVLVDSGCGIEHLKEIRREWRVDLVINSHTHPDHSAGNWVFEDVPIYVPREGFATSGRLQALAERFVEPNITEYWINFVKENMNIKECIPTVSYSEGDVFRFGETTLVALHTPGHTSDHYCFYEPHERVLLSFDYDFTPFGPWYGHRESSIDETRRSIERIRSLKPRIVVSGHKGIVRENIEGEFNKFLGRIDERETRILKLLEEGKTIDQLVEEAPIYGSFPYAEPLLRYWEKVMIEKHLEELMRRGIVRKVGLKYVAVTR